jgi:hypothetical protein
MNKPLPKFGKSLATLSLNMKAGCVLLIFVVANLLYAVYRTLKDTGLLTTTPASFERWLNS